MYSVKVYVGNYDKTEFYSIMGKFFAERVYKKIMPYLTNDKDKVWHLFYKDEELVGFCSVKICDDYTNFVDIYAVDINRKKIILKTMCEHLFRLYKMYEIHILTRDADEIKVWLKLGFKKIGEKGKYQNLLWVKKHE